MASQPEAQERDWSLSDVWRGLNKPVFIPAVIIIVGGLIFATWFGAEYGVTENDRLLQVASQSFDVSIGEIFGMLAAGARLVIRSGLADDSSRSRTTRITDRLANLAGWMQERAKCYPTADGLRTQLEGAGLRTTLRPLYGDTPFNNWLIVGERT